MELKNNQMLSLGELPITFGSLGGMPNQPGTGYGTSLRYELIPPEDYFELESRMAIFHSGLVRERLM